MVIVFAVPGDLATPTGGYGYDRRIIGELRALGRRVDVLELGEGFPRPSAETKTAAAARFAALAAPATVVVDGLALGVLPEAAEIIQRAQRLVAMVHHPLAHETGLTPAEAASFRESERRALSFAERVITSSAATARLLQAQYAVAPGRLSVVHPGTDRAAAFRREAARDGGLNLLAVGSIIPRKGYDVLIAALAALADRPWQLVISGKRDHPAAQALEHEIARVGLGGRIRLLGAISSEELSRRYAVADLFVLPSRFEGFGMAYAEAVAHGLPVVGTTAGAIPEAVPNGAGVLVPPDDVAALTAALRRLMDHGDERRRLSEAAVAAAARLPTWPEVGARFAQALDAVT